MGAIIPDNYKLDKEQFTGLVKQETKLLNNWLDQNKFSNKKFDVGFEIELLIVDEDFNLINNNLDILQNLSEYGFVPEVCGSNIELVTPAYRINSSLFSDLHKYLFQNYQLVAKNIENNKLLAIGLYPCDSETLFDYEFITDISRYRLVDEQLRKMRGYELMQLKLNGSDEFTYIMDNIALFGASSSVQMQLALPIDKIAAYYNSGLLLSGPILALASNSSVFLDHAHFSETRIQLFEDLLNCPVGKKRTKRFFFPDNYIENSIIELFNQNLDVEPLLPICSTAHKGNPFKNLQLHNGSIYPWCRPVLGFEQEDKPHMRLEYRVLPNSPSLVDLVSDLACLLGLLHFYSEIDSTWKQNIKIIDLKANFYNSAKLGLETEIAWFNNKKISVVDLFLEALIPNMRQGLSSLGIAEHDIEFYSKTILNRVSKKQNGASWQKGYFNSHNHDSHKMLAKYYQYQMNNIPVANWGYD